MTDLRTDAIAFDSGVRGELLDKSTLGVRRGPKGNRLRNERKDGVAGCGEGGTETSLGILEDDEFALVVVPSPDVDLAGVVHPDPLALRTAARLGFGENIDVTDGMEGVGATERDDDMARYCLSLDAGPPRRLCSARVRSERRKVRY